MITISNQTADIAVRQFQASSDAVQATMQMLSTGKRVSSVQDDPSAFVVAERLRSDMAALGSVSTILGFAEASTRVASAATDNITGLLRDIEQSYIRGQASSAARAQEDKQVQDVMSELAGRAANSTINGVNLIGGKVGADVEHAHMVVSAGVNGQTLTVGDQDPFRMDLSAAGLGLQGVVSAATGLSVNFGVLDAASVRTDGTPTQLIIQTQNYGNSAAESAGNAGKRWTFQFNDAASPIASTTSSTYDVDGNALEQDSVVPVVLRSGFTQADAVNALDQALGRAGFETQVDNSSTSGLTVNIAGNNIASSAGSSSVTNLLVPPYQLSEAAFPTPTTVPGAPPAGSTAFSVAPGAHGDTSTILRLSGATVFTNPGTYQTDARNYLIANPNGVAIIPTGTPPANTFADGTVITSVQSTADPNSYTVNLSQPTAGVYLSGYKVVWRVPASVTAVAWTGPGAVLATLNGAIKKSTNVAAALGDAQKAIAAAQERVASASDTLTQGIGTIVDADLTKVSANLVAQQIRQQLAIKSLSISNNSASILLQLFGAGR